MMKSVVYHGNSLIGEVEIYPQNSNSVSWIKEIRISHFSLPSERCPPLAVLYTIASGNLRFKMESKPSPSDDSPLFQLHTACLRENKTAVMLLGEEELHFVAMTPRKSIMNYSCFWAFSIPRGMYSSCLTMLNLRCLGIVFDLDETLIVANTMRSFEDRIEALQRKVSNETDPQRITGMASEIKRYQEDKSILKQYAENDEVVDNGRVFKVQSEVVPPLSDSHQLITRPIIRLQEKNIILTRVNPSIRDTSVLVRLRPAWEDLRSYLTAKGRKRFEVYVCTMAERDYALEMWRLLDPDSNLIDSAQLLDRIVCVKAGLRKSLRNVFQDRICHPRMALVIDDRLKVWDEKDQPRVHVVPAFAPYYAPQAEVNSHIPVLCVARNVACNVRGGFFKEFDEGLLPRICEVLYEDEIIDLPSAPDVGNYLISEQDDNSAINDNKDPLSLDGMADAEVERRLKEANFGAPAANLIPNNFEPNPIPSIQHIMPSSGAVSLGAPKGMMPLANNNLCPQPVPFSSRPVAQPGLPEPALQAREEGEVAESEVDPDTRRRLLILQHGQDTRDPPPPPPFPVGPPSHVSVPPPVQTRGNWFPLEEEMNPRSLNRPPKEFPSETETARFDKKRPLSPSYFHSGENPNPNPNSFNRIINPSQRFPVQLNHGDDRFHSTHAASNYSSFPGEGMLTGQIPSSQRGVRAESGRAFAPNMETPVGVLQDIATRCGSKVEFRTSLFDTKELQFCIEVWFVGDKIGEGVGRTRKDAQRQAAEISLHNLAKKYLSNTTSDPNMPAHVKENGFVSNSNSFGFPASTRDDFLPIASTSDESRFMDQRIDGSRKITAVAALKELCTAEGFNLVFQAQPSPSDGSLGKGEAYAQVVVAGQILGKGVGITWEEAKQQAADEALGTLKSMLGQFTQKNSGSPRSLRANPNKRFRVDFPRAVQRIPSSGR
ncbi:RNA polymerase II C-terminal domain phosphatase-like 1 isoform X3 [Ananas comosus]|uniref:protein-serine/threonine phosphatase n=1 Tax=Ananas comosus TaxID=4615 RepID=A0A6P5EMJ5_ANACO|nr:RNA polymerase II C-terminal domain phosphatase-like 1 isoform X3 [Ananas comosus]